MAKRHKTAPVGRLQRSQAARQSRVLATVLHLARKGGYDAIQLRAISDHTGVSSYTIYRYFGSRDRLIAIALRHWLERKFIEPAPKWFEGETPAEKILSFNRQIWRVWERHPRMLETFVRATLTEGGVDVGLVDRVTSQLVPLSAYVLRDVEPGYRADVLMILEHFTHSAMTYVIRGELAFSEVYLRLERTVRRLAEHPAMAGAGGEGVEWTPATSPLAS
jgi:AcrR family transcriptional regulator